MRGAAVTNRRRRTRQSIFDATLKLLGHEHGRNVRIEEICVEAKISRGTFYNYFPSVEDLFAALALELSHDFNIALINSVSSLQSYAERSNAAIQHYEGSAIFARQATPRPNKPETG